VSDDSPFLPGESFSDNNLSATVGLTVSPLPLVNVNAAYAIGEFNTISVGVGLGLR